LLKAAVRPFHRCIEASQRLLRPSITTSDKGPTEKAAEKLAVEFFDDMSDFEGAA
jgi:hypothetical protein